jgi:hypothetical protein
MPVNIRRIAVLAMNPWSSPGTFQPFSYGSYLIAASVIGRPEFEGVDVRVFDTHGWFLDRWVDEILAYEPDVVACSSYVWSTPTFYTLASTLRARAPQVKIVFGGPSARPELFALPPYAHATACIDALVVGEGEETFPDLLRAWQSGRSLAGVAGLAIPVGNRFVRNPKRTVIPNLDDIVSPYELGLVPPGVTAQLEPFRGCPMSCVFCQWGGEADGRRSMSAHGVTEEFRRFKRNKATGLYLVDAGINLNKRAFRAIAEAEAETGFIRDTHLTCEIYPAFLEEEHLELLRSTRSQVGLGLQSLDGSLLKQLERPFDRTRFEKVVESVCDAAQTTIELIVGLPGDSPEQFRHTLEQVRRLPCSVRVYHCLVLPDALLTRAPAEYRLDFDPITLEMRSCLGWSREDLLRTFDFLTEEVEKHGGTLMRYFPRPVEATHLEFYLGHPVGSSMWLFPNHTHEATHRTRHPTTRSAIVNEFARPVAKPHPAIHADSRLARLVQRVAARSTAGSWTVGNIGLMERQVRVEVASEGRAFAVAFTSEAQRREAYATKHGLAFWHEEMPTDENPRFDAFIDLLADAGQRIDLFHSGAPLRVVS